MIGSVLGFLIGGATGLWAMTPADRGTTSDPFARNGKQLLMPVVKAFEIVGMLVGACVGSSVGVAGGFLIGNAIGPKPVQAKRNYKTRVDLSSEAMIDEELHYLKARMDKLERERRHNKHLPDK